MNKRQLEKAERERLKQMIDNNPKLKAFLDAAVDETGNKELKDLIEPVLIDTFDKIRLQGIQTGWYAHALRCKAKIKACKSLDEAIEVMDKEGCEMAEKLGIDYDEVDEDGMGDNG